MILELHYGPHRIGTVEGAVWSDGTGYGVFRPSAAGDVGLERVRRYIAFSEEWHERLRADRPHDADEFRAFADVHESPLWHAVHPDGTSERVSGPVFVAGEVTWGVGERTS